MRQNKATRPKLSQMLSARQMHALQKVSLTLVASMMALFGSVGGASAADPFTEGSKAFKAKQYSVAAKHFEKAIEANSRNHVAYYYHALSLHYAKDNVGARKEYARIIQCFPMSDAASYSRKALAIMDPALLRSISPDYNPSPGQQPARSGGSSSSYSRPQSGQNNSSSSSNDRLPDEARISFGREAGGIFLDGTFNNRPAKVLFDTGSEATIFGKNHLQSMGIPEPSGAATNTSTSGGSVQKTWDMRMNIKVGNIERNNFPVVIKESMLDSPSLGKTFFKEYTCNVDNNARCLVLAKQGSRAAASASSYSSRANSDPYVVAFIKDDNDMMIVSGTIEGKTTQFIFDTGASSVMMSKDMAKKFGITVPEDVPDSIVNGTSGQTRGKKFPVRSIKVGAVEKRNIDITVVESFPYSAPLLGSSFYGDNNYSIDQASKTIRFSR